MLEQLQYGGRRVAGFGPARVFGLGDGAAQQAQQLGQQYGYSLYQQYSPQAQAAMSGFLSNYVPGGLAAAQGYVAMLNNLGKSGLDALNAAAAKNPGAAIGDMTPIVAAILAAESANPIVGAAVLGGMSILSEIVSLVSPPPTPQHCTYAIPPAPDPGFPSVCVTASARPAGPQDPDWVTIDQFDTGTVSRGGGGAGSLTWVPSSNTNDNQLGGPWALQAFGVNDGPWGSWWNNIGLELYALGDRTVAANDWALGRQNPASDAQTNYSGQAAILTTLTNLGPTGIGFLKAVDFAFIKASELLINGYAAPSPQLILQAVVQAWNAGYSSSSTYTFQPPQQLAYGLFSTFTEWVCAGGIDGQRIDPAPTINTGPSTIFQNINPEIINQAGPGSTSTSSPAATAVGVTAAAAGVGALSIAAYAYTQGISFLDAWRRLKRAVTGE